ncbi:uncharacterized protein MYCFIDRAFT_204190 [Pseudocercospora fijiensis CIRAD86]|uniref:Nuclear segregation protein n=1 Tax=Pseudocercospora fijiensis (strain CIRAD86) TaxID=383855 RepID=M3AUF5_PSEFD|nr:uncharacterized protein MYCFIDRAFT_204190 [Pseudocercospora fijiensis CIRAD86]EME81117.1 hypothetical protein MYCFIDRAFT_204190 [Pseudocercospora fijiensis CIRAD86]
MAETAAKPADKPSVVKPERPDEEAYKTNLAKAEKELQAADTKQKAARAKVDNARAGKDSPSSKRRAELLAELSQIRSQQASSKTGRNEIQSNIKRLDEQLKSRITEQKTARGKIPYKSADEVDQEITRLQKQVDAGTLKIVDERKALDEISKLNRVKKSFSGFSDGQKAIDDLKAKIAEERKKLEDPETKALSDRYTAIQAELDQMKAEQNEAKSNLDSLFAEKKKAEEERQKKYLALKELKDAYFSQRRAARDYEQEARRIRDEKRQAENDAYHRGRRQEAAKAKLDDASAPAYDEEIRIARSVLSYFDPSSVAKQEAAGPGKFAAQASRKIDDSAIKGTALKKKGDDDDDNYFVGGGGKKKKNRKAAPAASAEKFNLDVGTLDSLARIRIDPPMSQADVPGVVEKIKEKLAFWKEDQDRKTKENIANAQAEIDKLEAEATADASAANSKKESRKPAAEKQVNGSASAGAEKDVADAAQELEKAKIDDETETTTKGSQDA